MAQPLLTTISWQASHYAVGVGSIVFMGVGRRMKTVAEYRSYADQCRKLAAKVTTRPEDKEALQHIARQWASSREAHLLKQVDDSSGVDFLT